LAQAILAQGCGTHRCATFEFVHTMQDRSLDFDAVALIGLAHGRLLRLLSRSCGKHFQGLAVASRHTSLPTALRKKLLTLEAAHNVSRHITLASVNSLIKEVDQQLRPGLLAHTHSDPGESTTSCSPSATSTLSTRPPSTCSQTSINLNNCLIVDDPVSLVQAAVLNECARLAAALGPRRDELACLFDAAFAQAPDDPRPGCCPAATPIVVHALDLDHDPLGDWEPPNLAPHIDSIVAAAASLSALLGGGPLLVLAGGPSLGPGRALASASSVPALPALAAAPLASRAGLPASGGTDNFVYDTGIPRDVTDFIDNLTRIKLRFWITLWDCDRALLRTQDTHGVFVVERHLHESNGLEDLELDEFAAAIPTSSGPPTPRIRSWHIKPDDSVQVLRGPHSWW